MSTNNTLELMPLIPYNIINYLVENNELIWKLLKYNESNAWEQDNLTKAEKGALIYAGQVNMEDYRVFLDSGQDNSWTIESCILRIYTLQAFPTNQVVARLQIAFEIYCHYKISTMSNYQTRVDTIAQQIIETVHGAEVGGVGKLYFNAMRGSGCKIQEIGSIPFRGKGIVMCNWVA